MVDVAVVAVAAAVVAAGEEMTVMEAVGEAKKDEEGGGEGVVARNPTLTVSPYGGWGAVMPQRRKEEN
jgi:hypothetical protein